MAGKVFSADIGKKTLDDVADALVKLLKPKSEFRVVTRAENVTMTIRDIKYPGMVVLGKRPEDHEYLVLVRGRKVTDNEYIFGIKGEVPEEYHHEIIKCVTNSR